jgi:ligand-binding sensor domain-containing protein
MKHYFFIATVLLLLCNCRESGTYQPSVVMFNTEDGLPGNEVYSIVEDDLGNLWVGTNNGIAKYDGLAWQTYFDTVKVESKDVRNISIDKSGNIWFQFLFDDGFFL